MLHIFQHPCSAIMHIKFDRVLFHAWLHHFRDNVHSYLSVIDFLFRILIVMTCRIVLHRYALVADWLNSSAREYFQICSIRLKDF